jgi:hypothetical protein
VQLVVRVTNPNGCGSSDTLTVTIDPALSGKTLSGTLRYDNSAGSPVNDARIRLVNAQNQVTTAEVNSQGGYFFPNLPDGTYSVRIDTIRKAAGGITSADVTLINNYALGRTSPLSAGTPSASLRLRAADVSTAGTGLINIQDAQAASKKANNQTTVINSFELATPQRIWAVPANDTTVAINGADVTLDLNTVSYGDVNGSFSPALRMNSTVTTEINGWVAAEPGMELSYPIRAAQSMDLASWQMTFIVRDGYRVRQATAQGDASPVLVNQQGQKVSLLWFAESGQPVSVSNNEAIVTLNFVKEDAGSWNEPIVDPTLTDVEFNDAFAVTYLQPRINLPQIGGNHDLEIRIYPNPASKTESTRLALSSAWRGDLTILVKDALGRNVMTENLVNLPNLSSSPTIDLPLGQFIPGAYQCQIWVKTYSGEVLYRTLPFVIKN